MKRLVAKDLKIKFIETLTELDDFSYEEGNPFLIKMGSEQYFVFLKNISPAYFKTNPDICRVQLPFSDRFSRAFESSVPFVIFGYDSTTDTFVSWDPRKMKERLNAKGNVSLYSRYSLQEKVKDGEFKFGNLSNGERIVLFKRDNLINYFSSINDIFNEKQVKEGATSSEKIVEPIVEYVANTLFEITDKVLLQELEPLLRKNQVLQAVEITSKYYAGRYGDMTFKDWYKLVSDIHKKIIN